MTERVDFYVLKSSTPKQRWIFACRLTEKAYLRNLSVVLCSDSAQDIASLDELLWTFNERSFVPHDIHRTVATTRAPVQLTADLDVMGPADLLVNLSGRLPARLERFARIAEIIDADEERRRSGRERFKTYRELKLPLETHQLEDGTAD
jgi:DNA polymerase-3 subunit chi